ncbi:MAG: cation-translocating P-type ATPase [Roseiflexus sp.]
MSDHSLDQIAAMSPLEVCAVLQTAPHGLDEAEAHKRRERYGPNAIAYTLPVSTFRRLITSFINWISLILMIAGLLAFLGDTPVIGWVILVIALLNGIFTAWQEYLAERAIAALRQLLPQTAYVRRSGQVRQIPTTEVVPGDVLPLKPGTVVVADGYLISGEGLRVKQTALTGNDAPVTKVAGAMPDPTLALVERPNILLAGTVVFEGQGSLVAIHTGMQTLLGTIAESTAALRAEPSPLGQALNTLAATITRVAIIAGIGAFLLTVLGQQFTLQAGIIFAIGMIVAFVPEGLLPTVTLALALARRRLARYGVLVRRLAGVESLSSATVLCADRVETLTSTTLAVSAIWAGGRIYTTTGSDYRPEGAFLYERALVRVASEPDLAAVLHAAVLCNNSRLMPPDASHPDWYIVGDPLEGALLATAARGGIYEASSGNRVVRLQSFPYEPRRQLGSVVVAVEHNGKRELSAYVRGTGRAVLSICVRIQYHGTVRDLDETMRQEIEHAIDEYARKGQRVVAFATGVIDEPHEGMMWRARDIERDLTFLGFAALQEPPQPEVVQLIEGCRKAGIRVIIVTGAYGLTAEAIARRVGLIDSSHVQIVTGADLDAMSDANLGLLLAPLEDVLFAQLGAAHKQRIVEALQQRGEIVAFLGDSINDAPALQQAEIGVVVSASGTAVALAAADIVLNAQHPAGLLMAIEEGRAIFANIQKLAAYIFAHNVAEAVVIVTSVVVGIPLPLTVLQVLAIDVGTELLPSVALSTEPPEPGILEQPPRSRTAPLLDRETLLRTFAILGMLEGALALLAFFAAYWSAGWRPGMPMESSGTIYAQATTLTYMGIVMAQVGVAFAGRTRRSSVFRIGLFTNQALVIGTLLSVVLMLALVYIEPLATLFNFVPPQPEHWIMLACFPGIMLMVDEIFKWWQRRHQVAQFAF